MKKILCTFANHYMTKGFPRFKEQAESLQVFDDIKFFTQKDLGKDFRQKYGRYLFPYSRGFGYWAWKPYLLLKTLTEMDEGDILVYADLGCFFNPKGRKRMLEYFDIVQKSAKGVLGFRSYEVSSNGMPESTYYEYQYTKGDILDYFGVRDDKYFTDTTQFEATVIFFRRTDVAIKFLQEWLDTIYEDTTLITDEPSRSSNMEGFIENRHDQSIYSILAKKLQISELSTNEIFAKNQNWSLLEQYPILAIRDKYYRSKFHYKYRFRIRSMYNRLWALKYFFKKL